VFAAVRISYYFSMLQVLMRREEEDDCGFRIEGRAVRRVGARITLLGNFSWLSAARASSRAKEKKRERKEANTVRPQFICEQRRREHGLTISPYGFRIALTMYVCMRTADGANNTAETKEQGGYAAGKHRDVP
jgi:hypothetical protein